MTDDELAGRLKDLAGEMDLFVLSATRTTSPQTWTTVEVRHASLLSESPDGWDVKIAHGGL